MADQAIEPRVQYDGVAKALHWIVALLMLVMLTFGWSLGDLPLDEKVQTLVIHSSLGLSVFILMVVRLFWRRAHTPPALPGHVPDWQVLGSKVSHYALYFFTILQPVLGVAQSAYADFEVRPFGAFTVNQNVNESLYGIFHELHELNAMILVGLVGLHVSAALYHHYVQKDTVLKRMLPFGRA